MQSKVAAQIAIAIWITLSQPPIVLQTREKKTISSLELEHKTSQYKAGVLP